MVFHRDLSQRSIAAAGLRLLVAALLVLSIAVPARAASLIRDPDIEYALQKLAAPVLRAAGLSPTRVRVLIINDSSLNAFVVGGNAIFVHHGLLLKLESADQFQAIVAHEAAHIANGHITRRMTNLRSSRSAAGLGIALAAIAAASGADSKVTTGLAIGSASSAQRLFLKHTRAEEASADQSGLRYLLRAGINPQGMTEVHSIFRGQEALAEHRQDPYVRSHPLSRDRVRAAEAFVAANPSTAGTDPSAAYWFARAKGKLSAFTRAPKWTLRRAGESPSKDIRAMREAVAYHRQSNTKKALKAMNAALAARPNDPFLYELKGQILLESRQLNAAVNAYGRAVQLAPKDALILGSYGRALLATGQTKKALAALERARDRDFRDGRVLRDLAVSYAKLGQNGMASLVTAERYALQGRLDDASIHAKRASGLLPRGSGPWQRAQDVLSAAKNQPKRRKRG